jgi:hypothetical protein
LIGGTSIKTILKECQLTLTFIIPKVDFYISTNVDYYISSS